MIHAKCGTFIPDSECQFEIIGRRAKVYGDCPNCKQDKRKYLGTIAVNESFAAANYHGVSESWFNIAKRVNHSRWALSQKTTWWG